MLARLVTGRLCDINGFHPRVFFHLGIALSGLSTLLLPLVTSYPLLFLYSVVYGVSDGMMCCGVMVLILSCLPQSEAPAGFGLFQCVVSLAYAGGPPLGGKFISFLLSSGADWSLALLCVSLLCRSRTFTSVFPLTAFLLLFFFNRPFAGPGHVTYLPLNLRPGTFRVPEMKRAGKTK